MARSHSDPHSKNLENIQKNPLGYRPIALTRKLTFVRHRTYGQCPSRLYPVERTNAFLCFRVASALLYVDDLQISCEGSDMHDCSCKLPSTTL
ncbi:hypothetical protein TNCV_4823441 [Trichonephila clavipes]|nr:hypothetical protein TNCV_4823441 [Trichonephila clavipes]